ncbi:MAG: hypothetical protein ACI9WU_003147, partial [Myxococcota bacterium]
MALEVGVDVAVAVVVDVDVDGQCFGGVMRTRIDTIRWSHCFPRTRVPSSS